MGRMLVILVLQNRKFRVQADRAFKCLCQLACMHLRNKTAVRLAHVLLTSRLHFVTSEWKLPGADNHSGRL